MKIKINNQTHKIKPATELTVSEYMDYFARLDENSGSIERLITYISVITGYSYRSIASVDVNPNSIRRMFAYIGNVPIIKDIPTPKEFYYLKTGKVLYQKKVNWQTVGVRSLLEYKGATIQNQIELLPYLLAIFISGDYDSEKVEEIYKDLQDYNAFDVFGFSVFFLIKLYPGKKPGQRFLRKLRKRAKTNTAKRSNK